MNFCKEFRKGGAFFSSSFHSKYICEPFINHGIHLFTGAVLISKWNNPESKLSGKVICQELDEIASAVRCKCKLLEYDPIFSIYSEGVKVTAKMFVMFLLRNDKKVHEECCFGKIFYDAGDERVHFISILAFLSKSNAHKGCSSAFIVKFEQVLAYSTIKHLHFRIYQLKQ